MTTPVHNNASSPSYSRKVYRAVGFSLTLIAASALLLSDAKFSRGVDELSVIFSKHFGSPPPKVENKFSWNKIQPSETLQWNHCYVKFQCARLTVPLNYSNPSGEKATIALTRLPSSLPPDSPEYRGPIVINPGGPGGSGVDMALRAGEHLSAIVGPEFDILGFDPRGINHSTPRVSFFENGLERALWPGNTGTLSVVNATADGLARAWAGSKMTGQLAWERQSEILGHINTDQTARDMLSIVKAHGREKILFWGFSYGTVLGATFASMFPNNIERLVMDGVVDIEDYYSGLWSSDLIDTSKTMDYFFTSCHAAGPDACAFYAPSPELIAANLTNLYTSVKARPVPVRTATNFGLVDYSRLRTTVFLALYKPWAVYPELAHALAALSRGDGAPLFAMISSRAVRCDCDPDPEFEEVDFARDAQTTIICNDGDPVSDTFEDLEKYFADVTEKSEWAEIWAVIRTACVGWPHKPKNRFRGPFKANTSFPILLVGNTADPVTPLWAAKETGKGFPDSVVLTQDSAGHCSLSAPSVCTQTYIRDYFVKGTLPPSDTICPVIGTPFSSREVSVVAADDSQRVLGDEAVFEKLSTEDRTIYEAARKLSLLYSIKPLLY